MEAYPKTEMLGKSHTFSCPVCGAEHLHLVDALVTQLGGSVRVTGQRIIRNDSAVVEGDCSASIAFCCEAGHVHRVQFINRRGRMTVRRVRMADCDTSMPINGLRRA
jgi:hypothetical protein